MRKFQVLEAIDAPFKQKKKICKKIDEFLFMRWKIRIVSKGDCKGQLASGAGEIQERDEIRKKRGR